MLEDIELTYLGNLRKGIQKMVQDFKNFCRNCKHVPAKSKNGPECYQKLI